MPKSLQEDKKAILTILDAAILEFKRDGKVTTARCNVCASLIELQWLGPIRSAVSVKCPCGKFHGTMKGLLN